MLSEVLPDFSYVLTLKGFFFGCDVSILLGACCFSVLDADLVSKTGAENGTKHVTSQPQNVNHSD